MSMRVRLAHCEGSNGVCVSVRNRPVGLLRDPLILYLLHLSSLLLIGLTQPLFSINLSTASVVRAFAN